MGHVMSSGIRTFVIASSTPLGLPAGVSGPKGKSPLGRVQQEAEARCTVKWTVLRAHT